MLWISLDPFFFVLFFYLFHLPLFSPSSPPLLFFSSSHFWKISLIIPQRWVSNYRAPLMLASKAAILAMLWNGWHLVVCQCVCFVLENLFLRWLGLLDGTSHRYQQLLESYCTLTFRDITVRFVMLLIRCSLYRIKACSFILDCVYLIKLNLVVTEIYNKYIY